MHSRYRGQLRPVGGIGRGTLFKNRPPGLTFPHNGSGIGQGAVGPAQEGGLARLGDHPVDTLPEPDAQLLAEAAALERAGGEVEVVLVGIVEVETRDSEPAA